MSVTTRTDPRRIPSGTSRPTRGANTADDAVSVADASANGPELTRQLLRVREQERGRIARDLHDTLGQRVTALRLTLQAVGRGRRDWRRALRDLQQLADEMDRELDVLAWQLRPPAIEDVGFAAALEALVREWGATSGIPARFHASGVERRLEPDVETCLYRVLQEALTNVLKHARATGVAVLLHLSHDEVVLTVEDEGRGFAAERATRHGGGRPQGVTGMRERAALVGGTLEIESAKGRGTSVLVRVPA